MDGSDASRKSVASAHHPSRRPLRCTSSMATLAHFSHEHRHPQPSALCLARKEVMLPLRQMPPLAVVLGMGMGQETRPQEHRVLAVFLAQRVDTLNWLRVLGTAELAQIDQGVCQQLHAIMPLLYTFKS